MTIVDLTLPTGRRYSAKIPQNWEEVPRRHLPRFLHAAYAAADPVAARLKLIRRVAEWPMRLLWMVDPVDLYFMQETLAWITEPSHLMPFPVIWHRGVEYRLPGNGFEKASAIRWALADEFFGQLSNGGKDDAVLNLCASILASDIADRDDVSAVAEQIREMPGEYLAALVAYFAGVKAYVHKMYGAWLFRKEEEDEDDQPSGPNFGWWAVFFRVAESGTFGDYDRVLQMNFHTMCVYLVEKQKEADEARRRMRNTKAMAL